MNEKGSIKYSEVIRGVLTSLGYDKKIDLTKKGYSEYSLIASQLRITQGMNLTSNDFVTPEIFAKIIYNSLNVPMFLQTGFGTSDTYEQKKDVTILTYYHKIYYGKGQITDDGISSFMGNSYIGKDEVKIGDKIFKKGNVGEEYLFAYYTEFYYRDTEDISKLLWINAKKDTNGELFVEATDISNYENGVYSYYVGDNTKKITLDKDAVILYNGKVEVISKLSEKQLMPATGEITFLDINRNSKYDVAIIMDYSVDTVSYCDIENKIIYFKNNQPLKIDENSVLKISDKKFKNLTLEDISVDNTTWYAKSIDGEITTILVSDNVISGKIEGINQTDLIVTISGKDYFINENTADNILRKVKIGDEGTFYLDIQNAIVDFEKESFDYKYAYLIKASISENIDQSLKFLVFDGKIKTMEVAPKVSVNFKNYSDADIVLKLLNKKDTIEQLICFKTNKDGKISELQYVEDETPTANGGQKLHVAGALPKRGEGDGLLYKHSGYIFTNYFALEETAPVFIIPGDRQNLDKYVLGTPASIGNDDFRYGVIGYKLDERSDSCVAAVYDDNQSASVTGFPKSEKPLIVKNVTRAILDDGEVGSRINCYDTDAKLTYFEVADDDFLFEKMKELKAGDIIRVDVTNGSLIDWSLDYNYVTHAGKNELLTYNYDNAPRVSFGEVYRRNKQTVLLDVIQKPRDYIDYELVQLNKANRILVVSLDGDTPNVRIGSEAQVRENDKLYYTCSFGFIRYVIVFK